MASPQATQKITERRAARAARQLLYHRRLMDWISCKTAENEATLENYLISSGEDRVVLLGGYALERASQDQESAVEVSEPVVAGAELRYEQLELPEAFEHWETS